MKKIIVFMLLFLLSGCAYIVNGDTQTIYFGTSDHKKVKAKIKNDNIEAIHTLPSVVEVKKSSDDLLITTIETDCITSTEATLKSSMDNWAWGNIATLGLGFIWDARGAMWKYDKEYMIVDVNRDNECIKKAKKLNAEILNLHQ